MFQRRRRNQRRKSGQSLVETMTGFLVLIPIGLVSFDIVTLVTAAQTNEQLAETCARAAATQSDQGTAEQCAQDAITHCVTANMIENVQVEAVHFDPVKQQVVVVTTMDVRMPVPLPYFTRVSLRADAMEPIVSTPAQR